MNRQIFIFSILVVILAVGLWGFVWPQWQVFSLKMEEVKSAENNLAETKVLKEKLASLTALYQNKEKTEELEKIFSALPQKNDIPSLLVNLESLASQSGLVIKSVGFTEDAKKTKSSASDSAGGTLTASLGSANMAVKSLGVSLVLSGDYSGFVNFLRSAEMNLRLMDIESLSFQQDKGIFSSEPSIEGSDFSVDLKVYYK